MMERTTVRLPKELMRRAKRKAAEQGRTLTALIEDALWWKISEDGKIAKRPRGPLPISTATGGLMPGVDITRFSDIQGMDDLEYMERLKSGFK
jgi:hypothetical protein